MTDKPGYQRTIRCASHMMRQRTGVVIPVYLPEGVDIRRGRALLEDTAEAYCTQVADPATVCMSVDGESNGAGFARELVERLGASCHVAPINRGKLAAAIDGVRVLLANPGLRYVAIVDQDGDHFANELPNFIRVAQHIATCVGRDHTMVLGRRVSRHRPLGFYRGELEEFADRILLDTLFYNAALTGRPLRLEYAATLDEFPDFHSGYKLFSRSLAEQVFLGERQLAGCSPSCCYRHACEAVMVVEALEHEGYLGVVNRSTFNQQPISTFGLMDMVQLVADKIIWPCKRLRIPLPFVKQWMANHSSGLLLSTLSPNGVELLDKIRCRVLAALAGKPNADGEPDLQPLFV